MRQDSKNRTGRRSSWPVVAALVVALLFSVGASTAQELTEVAGEELTAAAKAAFAKLDRMECVPSSTIARLDQLFITLHDYDARSILHSRYSVCPESRRG